jgi:PAS domain-containing protein
MERDRQEFMEVLEGVLGVYGFSPVVAWALRFVLRNPHESMVVTDREGRFVFLDRGSEKFFGLDEGEGKGTKVTDLIPSHVHALGN